MGMLRGLVDTVITNMSPDERVEAIREVAEQAMEMMTDEERLMLAEMVLVKLLDSMDGTHRERLVERLAPTPAFMGQNQP